jgi:hypothetical protein
MKYLRTKLVNLGMQAAASFTIVALTISSFLMPSAATGEALSPILKKTSQNSLRPKNSFPPIGRDPSCVAIPLGSPDINALTPIDAQEVTTTISQNPTFYFYSPYSRGKYRFKLYTRDKKALLLHSQDITLQSSAGIFAVSLPTVNAIESQKYYRWELEYLCTKKGSNPVVFGNLYRDKLTSSQRRDFIKAKTPIERILFYQENGIWLEMIDEIAKSLPTSKDIWQKTLNAEMLQSISNKPIISVKSSIKP